MKVNTRRKKDRFLAVAALFFGWAVSTLHAESGGGYLIKKSTIDSGGGTVTGGSYRLSGTVGQHDAGPLAGGAYTLTGGFWSPVTSGGTIDPPTKGADDVCVGGTNVGNSCAVNSDCPGAGGFCRNKNRFITAEIPGTATSHGLKVTLVNIDSNSVATPSNYNGTDRWVGAPTLGVNDGISPVFNAAKIQCAFVSQNWSAVGRLHIYGEVVVPFSTYDLSSCNPQATCSTTLRLGTAKFGDVVAPVNTTNFQDIGSIVDKFQNKPSGPSKTRTKLRESVDPTAAISFLEISTDVSAFQGKTYKQVFPAPPATCP